MVNCMFPNHFLVHWAIIAMNFTANYNRIHFQVKFHRTRFLPFCYIYFDNSKIDLLNDFLFARITVYLFLLLFAVIIQKAYFYYNPLFQFSRFETINYHYFTTTY